MDMVGDGWIDGWLMEGDRPLLNTMGAQAKQRQAYADSSGPHAGPVTEYILIINEILLFIIIFKALYININ